MNETDVFSKYIDYSKNIKIPSKSILKLESNRIINYNSLVFTVTFLISN